jgi:hypothetical protein
LESGDVRCWGRGDSGELGLSDTEDIGDDEHPLDVGPISLGGPAVQVASGGSHSCAILESGDLRCWGSSGFGQLGYGNRITIGDNEPPLGRGSRIRWWTGRASSGGRGSYLCASRDRRCSMLGIGERGKARSRQHGLDRRR